MAQEQEPRVTTPAARPPATGAPAPPGSVSAAEETALPAAVFEDIDEFPTDLEGGDPTVDFQEYEPVVEDVEEFPDDMQTPPEPTVKDKIVGRFWGTDVEDDPQIGARAAAQVVGSLAGGRYGAKVPRMPGPAGWVVNPVTGAIAFSAIGNFVGATFPEATLKGAEALGFLPKDLVDEITLSGDELKTILEGEMLLEAATVGGLSALRLTGRQVAQIVAGISKAEKTQAGLAYARGIAMLPVQVGRRELARGYVSVMGRFPIFGGVIRRAGQAAEGAAKVATFKTLERVGPITYWDEVSEEIFTDAKFLLESFSHRMGKEYRAVFQQADELGVKVWPEALTSKGAEIVKTIDNQATLLVRNGELTAGEAGKVSEAVKGFINSQILPMRITQDFGQSIVKQNFTAMDGVITKIDEFIASLEPGQQKYAITLMTQLRQSAQLDMIQNVTAVSRADAAMVSTRLKRLDNEWSNTMSSVFETATANRFGSVVRRGLRAAGAEQLTRIPVDQLAAKVTDLKSPQMVDELARLVSPRTMRRVASASLYDAVNRAQTKAGQLDPLKLAQELGLDDLTSPRARTFQRMLDLAQEGVPEAERLGVSDYREMVDILTTMGATEIPDISTFVARRATLGGLKTLVSTILPVSALAGAGTGAGITFGGLVGAATFIGGARLLSGMLANPANARFLKDALSEEASSLVRRKATIQALRGGIDYLREEGIADTKTAAELERATSLVMTEIARQTNADGANNE